MLQLLFENELEEILMTHEEFDRRKLKLNNLLVKIDFVQDMSSVIDLTQLYDENELKELHDLVLKIKKLDRSC